MFFDSVLLVLSGSSATIITHFLKFFHPQKLLDALSSYDIHLTPVSEFKKLALELDPKIGNEKLENIEKAINTVRNEEEGDTVGKEQKMEDTVVNEENLEHLQEPTWMMEKVKYKNCIKQHFVNTTLEFISNLKFACIAKVSSF